MVDAHPLAFGTAARFDHGVAPDRLAVYDFIATRRSHFRNRAYAVQTLPWLLPMMTLHASGRQLREAPGILAAIDAASPLIDAV